MAATQPTPQREPECVSETPEVDALTETIDELRDAVVARNRQRRADRNTQAARQTHATAYANQWLNKTFGQTWNTIQLVVTGVATSLTTMFTVAVTRPDVEPTFLTVLAMMVVPAAIAVLLRMLIRDRWSRQSAANIITADKARQAFRQLQYHLDLNIEEFNQVADRISHDVTNVEDLQDIIGQLTGTSGSALRTHSL